MKKLLSIALCVTVASAFADPIETELGQVGVTKIETALSNVVVAVSYEDLAGGQMVYSNLVKTTNLTKGDRLIEFRDDKYTGWVLAQSGDVKYWQEQLEFIQDSDGKQIGVSSPTPDTVRGAVGMGIWLIRQNPTDADGKPIPFYIYGKTSSARTYTTVAGKWNLVGNPTQEDVTIGASNFGSGLADFDRIAIPGPNGLIECTYKASKGWRRNQDASGEWGSAPTIGAGLGFWLKTANEVEVKW